MTDDFVFHPSGEVEAYDGSRLQRQDEAVEMFQRHARATRPDTNYDADIEYLGPAVLAFAEEWAARP